MFNPTGLKWYQKLWLKIIYPGNKKFYQGGNMETETLANIKAKGNKKRYIKWFEYFKKRL
jgi:hypothetical protein